MRHRRAITSLLAAALLLGGCQSDSNKSSQQTRQPAEAVEPELPQFDGLDVLSHEIETDSELAQEYFDQGLVLYYGFNHAEAHRSFRQARQLDPQCAICYWGEALAIGPNINAAMAPESVPKAWNALQSALENRDHASPRHRAYIDALAARYAEDPPDDRTPLDEAYAAAMADVVEQYPDDVDAAALYGEALMIPHAWDYWEDDGTAKEWTPRILEVLEGALEQDSEHPFANHLYIHAVEASKEPERAMASARRLENMVPGAGHLVHMPAHIYIRTGDYHRASLQNEKAAESDERYVTQCHASGVYPLAYHPHNYHFLWATTTMEGRSEDAIKAAEKVSSMVEAEQMRKPGMGTLQHYYSIPWYALVTFGKWDRILETEEPADDLLYPRGVWHWARGMAFVAKGDLDAAEGEREAVAGLAEDPRVENVTIWDINSTARLLAIGEALLAGRIAAEREQWKQAITHMRKAVELEDGLNYDEPPPWGQPTRRYLGAVLLDAGQPEQAEAAYRADLNEFPSNGWSLFGLMQTLQAQGDEKGAAKVRSKFDAAWKYADVTLERSVF